jgi:hypothetical protein
VGSEAEAERSEDEEAAGAMEKIHREGAIHEC